MGDREMMHKRRAGMEKEDVRREVCLFTFGAVVVWTRKSRYGCG